MKSMIFKSGKMNSNGRKLHPENKVIGIIRLQNPSRKNKQVPSLNSLVSNALWAVFCLIWVFRWEICRAPVLCNYSWSWALDALMWSAQAVGDLHPTEWSPFLNSSPPALFSLGSAFSQNEWERKCYGKQHGKNIWEWRILCPKCSLNNRQ